MTVAQSEVAHALESAEADYLYDRVASLATIMGNPHRAAAFASGPLKCFYVATNDSPMNSRLCGFDMNSKSLPDAAIARFKQAGATVHIPAIGDSKGLADKARGFGATPKRGWTHGQFWADLTSLPEDAAAERTRHLEPVEVERFVEIHSAAFRSSGNQTALAQDMFRGLLADGQADAYCVDVDGAPVAIGLVYFAKNKTAYLATAATTAAARRKGAHSALIARRILAAKERGCLRVSATALLNSQSRRNLQRAGLSLSHVQTILALS